ncbi:hypothetical protein MKZ38_002532 [Zalerion maritima]|uniref:Acyltransferase 3 domain-containing protein n=1 Tax=Zalerion maritima TaxID=339359 RepID=A0AAD5RFA8_9PEZI|nr:hypothetical protein MKZ38_002532 [Zalerion maritima]
MNVVVGMVVADMHVTYGDQATQLVPRVIPFLMIPLAMFFASYPQNASDWAPWSNWMRIVMESITHKESDVRRYWDSLGACTLFVAIFLSGPLRRLFTSKVFNFIGRVSFPVYLMHNTLIKTVLAWMVYFPSYLNPKFNDQGEKLDLEAPGKIHMTVAIVAFYYILYRLGYLWTCTIDVLIDKWIKAGMRWASGQTATPEEKAQPILAK